MAKYSALIFGGSGGIGSQLAGRLADEDAELILVARHKDRLEAVADELGAHAIVADVTQPDQVKAAFDEAEKLSSAPIMAVANAVGSVLIKPAHLTSDEEWHFTITQNLHSSFYIVREATKRMRKTGGSIVLFASAVARAGIASHEAIAAAKAGVIGLARSAAATYANAGIRVNAIAPGLVETSLTESITGNEASLKVSLAMHPLGRIGKPDDIARAAAWVLSPEQSWVTGQVIGVDGGLSTLRSK